MLTIWSAYADSRFAKRTQLNLSTKQPNVSAHSDSTYKTSGPSRVTDLVSPGVGRNDPKSTEWASVGEFLTPREIATITGLHVAVVRRGIGRGELRAHKLCSRLRVRREDFDAWIASNVVDRRPQ